MKKIIFLFAFLHFNFLYAERWVINSDHSEINFSVNYLTFSKVHGKFSKLFGGVEIDNDVPQSLDIKVDVGHINTGQKLRDGHLLKKDFFNYNNFRFIEFSSSEIISEGQKFKAMGLLKVKNREKKVEVLFELSEKIKDTWNKNNRFANFSFTINRSDFDLDWSKEIQNNKYLVGDEVNISGSIQLQPKGNKTLGSKHLIVDSAEIKLRERLKRGEISKREIPSLKTDSPLLNYEKNVEKKAEIYQEVSTKKSNFLPQFSLAANFLIGLLSLFLNVYFLKEIFKEDVQSKFLKWSLFSLTFLFYLGTHAYLLYIL